VVQEAVKRANLPDPTDIDEVYMGNVVSAGLGQNPARQAAIHGGLPASVGATSLNKVCGSGLKTVMLAAQAIKAGDGKLFVCGGFESMSRAPYLVHGRSGELRFGHVQFTDALLHDGLWCALEDWGMGNAAEFIAEEYNVSREAMDDLAYKSHQNALAAIESGKFKAEIVPVELKGRKVNKARLFVGACAPIPMRAPRAEKSLTGKMFTEKQAENAGEAASQEALPITDVRATRDYRNSMVAVMTKRALLLAHKRAK
jgi:acetyl-CoA C-acetyltransferase